MLRRTLLVGVCVLCVLVVVPALASGQSLSDMWDETEPETSIDHVKTTRKGTVKVYFSATDPFDPVEDITFDCAIDPDQGGGGADDEDDDDEDDEGWEDDPFSTDASHMALSSGPSKWECKSPWTVRGLERGRHTVEVVALDNEWNEDPTPATAQFKVKKKRKRK